jgi:hypothetical protein
MKKAIFIFSVSFAILSCEKDYLIPKKDIPDWLRTQIEILDQKIKDDPSKMSSFGAWIRFEWKNDYYFEYSNPLSSYIGGPISFQGDTLNIFTDPLAMDYSKDKCCKRYVWKGPKYKEY